MKLLFLYIFIFFAWHVAVDAISCPAGQYRIVCEESCATCPPGYYCEGDQKEKIRCPAGTYRDSTGGISSGSCTACANGYYSFEGSVSCTPCPLGYDCTNPANPVKCALGYYTPKQGDACTLCLAGFYCPSPEVIYPCPVGTSQPSMGQISCTPCSNGEYADTLGSTSCKTCPAGFKCSESSHTPVACTIGTYSDSGKCEYCPIGHKCTNPSEDPVPCEEGTFSPGGIVFECHSCPLGTYSGVGQGSCTRCPFGESCVDKKDSTRTVCTSGQYSPLGHGFCENCPPGTKVRNSKDGCEICPAGSKCAGGDNNPVICPDGYITSVGKSECSRCPSGTYPNTEKSSCVPCPPGKECPYSTEINCPSGYYSLGGYPRCLPAPAGTYVPNPGALPQKCDDGTWSNQASTSCSPCPAGYTCALSTIPIKCPSGQISKEGEMYCTPCPAGYQCIDPVSNSTCDEGYYSHIGDPECHLCPPGYFCGLNAMNPLPCPDGLYSSQGSSECSVCEAGKYCPDPASPPLDCPDGTYSSEGLTICTKCREGFYCTSKVSSLQSSPEIPCEDGYISAPGSTSCQPCPAGMACPAHKEFNPVICSPGHYSTSAQQECQVCPQGYYCANPSQNPVICPPGTFSNEGASECSSCPAGYYCTGGTAAPVLCPTGRYSFAGESSTACQPCIEGYECAQGSTSPTPPSGKCSSGTYCENTNARSLCPAGTYGIGGGLSSQATACGICPAGYFCAIGTEAISEAILCPRGYYCPAGTTFATENACPAGTYNPLRGAVSSGACRVCPAGFYCAAGTSHYSSYICERGWFCPEGSKAPGNAQGPQQCPSGTYYSSYGAKNATDCQPCPPGYYCGGDNRCDGTWTQSINGYNCPLACPAGTYNSLPYATNQVNCLPCPDGYSCPTASSHPTKHSCYPGHFCDEGTSCTLTGTVCYPPNNNPDTRCPAGTYTTSYHLKKEEDCSICWEGYACPTYSSALGCTANPADTGNSCPIGCEPGYQSCPPYVRRMIICSPGHYCPGAPVTGNMSNPYTIGNYDGEYSVSPDQYDCPPGTYSPESGLKSADECTVCDQGKYCVGGQTAPDGDCASGHYCPYGTKKANQYPCPSGTYNPNTNSISEDDCTPCPKGSYCLSGSSSYIPCPAGTYNPSTKASSEGPVKIEEVWKSTGLYFNVSSTKNYDLTVLTSQLMNSQCVVCPAGYYCDSDELSEPTACPIGTYSDIGSKTCEICPVGYYCAREAIRKEDLPSFICPAGLYCPEGTYFVPDRVSMACPVAKYCPEGASIPLNCSSGTYNPNTGLEQSEDCLPCPRGYYCLEGSKEVTGNCSTGYYCPTNSSSPTMNPCPANTYRDRENAFAQSHCAECPNGHYCPEATSDPLICPQGYYCIIGVSIPAPCPMGTYGNSTGLKAIDECTPCDPGYYCETLGMTKPSGECDAGYYCILGASTAAPIDGVTGDLCPRGGFCSGGSYGPESCAAGTFNNYTGGKSQEDCAPCSPGYYCAGSSNPYPTGPCTAGYYCISNDTHTASNPRQYEVTPGHYSIEGSKTEIPCPAGTYSMDFATANNCTACESGYFCPTVGTSNRDENPCPAGSYCPRGSILPTGCPKGTFGSSERYQNASQCEPCPAGKFCDGDRLTAPVGDCLAGYFCYGISEERNPNAKIYGDLCPSGKWCQAGTTSPVNCSIGSFNPLMGATTIDFCLSCPAGYYCEIEGLSAPTGQCAEGYFCPNGFSASTPTPSSQECPIGYYCPQGTPSKLMCVDGFETNTTGMTACQECSESSYCYKGSVKTTCPEGKYCPSGTGLVQFKCPPGTFNPSLGLKAIDECTLCTNGSYCPGWGLTAPEGLCSPGTYCASGASTPTGDIGILGGDSEDCPPGSYCPLGVQFPIKCPAGKYASTGKLQKIEDCQYCNAGFYCPVEGQTQISDLCSEGFYCDIDASVANPAGKICPKGHKCPIGSPAPIPCEEGTYQNETGMGDCKVCPERHYCDFATINPVNCTEGHYCPEGTGLSLPKCPPGSYGNHTSLKEITECILCDGGFFCSEYGLTSPNGGCRSGIVCVNGSADIDGNPGVLGGYSVICPPGHYCEVNTSVPNPCPIGTFSNWTGNLNVFGCSYCPPGFYCDELGIIDPSNKTCLEGYYCLSGATTPTPLDGTTGNTCPSGFYCPNGTASPLPCPPGSYSPSTGAVECIGCLEGYYCEGETVTPTICPLGSYCPENTTYEIPKCPEGSFSDSFGLKNISECTLCSPGKYCDGKGLTFSNGICAEGYFCSNGSMNARGEAGILGGVGGICPPGYYCPLGSITPTPCSPGTFNPSSNATDYSDCLPCPPGFYCNESGLSTPGTACDSGFYCTISETISNNTICPDGHYCVSGATYPRICIDGTYQNETGKSKCDLCPSGRYCISGSILPISCPLGSYCPEGYGYPIFCPLGTYGANVNLTSVQECELCPAGKFCTNGIIRGDCHAGYVCYNSSWTASPKNTPLSIGELCPMGYYCPQGTIMPIPCPSGTVGSASGGRNITICGPCPKGYHCPSTSMIAEICPEGHYCPAVVGIAEACPEGTYNPEQGSTNETACLPCPEGYTCTGTARSMYSDLCPVGNYCQLKSINATECPAGTYRNETSGVSVEDCYECPPKYYCSKGTVNPIDCVAGNYCIAGSILPAECPGGYYCPSKSDSPIDCPSGFYCEIGSTTPKLCSLNSYCPQNTEVPILCPYGYRTLLSNTLSRTSQEDSCEICPAGTYGNTTDQIECYTCDAGYICLEGATAPNPVNITIQRGYICPAGYYCPAGSTSPIACPAGTYLSTTMAISANYCISCPANMYSDSIASTECRSCGSSAISSSGSTTCSCIGKNRAYQKSDGICLCEPGYTYYDSFNNEVYQDSSDDCVKIVYSRCGSGETHNSQGQCVSIENVCSSVCTTGGAFVTTYGICECNEAISTSPACDTSCIESSNRIRYNETTKTFTITKDGNTSSIESTKISAGILSSCNNSNSDCELHVIRTSSSGFIGIYNPSFSFLDSSNSTDSRKRFLFEIFNTSDEIGVTNPIACIKTGEGLLFDIPDKTNYPVYDKDSLLNTVPNFDFGPFRDLGILASSNFNLKSFLHFFTQEGTFVFYDASDSSKLLIVRTMDEGCPNNQTFFALNQVNLASLGISPFSSLPLTPDWRLIGVLLISFFAITGSILVCLSYFKRKGWITLAEVQKKRLADMRDLSVEEKIKILEKEGRTFDSTICLEELDQHAEQIEEDLGSLRSQFQDKYNTIFGEMKTIRSMLGKRKSGTNYIDISSMSEDLNSASNVSEVRQTLKDLKKQIKNLEQELKECRESISIDTSHMNIQQKQAVNKLKEIKIKEEKNLSNLIIQYKEAYKELNAEEEVMYDEDISSEDLEKKISEFNSQLLGFKKGISKRLDDLNGIVLEKNQIEEELNQKVHTFDLDDNIASQLKDFLSKKVGEMFEKYELAQELELVEDDTKSAFNELEEEVEKEQEEGIDNELAIAQMEQEEDNVKTAEERLKFSKKKRQKQLIIDQKNESNIFEIELQEEFEEAQEELISKFHEIEDGYMNQLKSAVEAKLSDPNISKETKDKLLKELDQKTTLFRNSVEKDRKLQEAQLKSLLESKRRAKEELLQKKQDKEREIFQKLENEENKAINRIMKTILEHPKELNEGVSIELLKQKEILKRKLETGKDRLKQKHELEKKELQDLLNSEDILDQQVLKETLKAQQRHLLDAKRQTFDDLLDLQAQTPEQRQELLIDFNKKISTFKKTQKDEKKQKEKELQEKLDHRRNVQMRNLENKHAQEEENLVQEQEKDLKALKSLMEKAALATEDIEGARTREKLKQMNAIEQKLQDLKKKRKEKMQTFKDSEKVVEDIIEAEKEEEITKINKKFAEEQRERIQEKEEELAKQLQAPDVTEQKKEQLLATHRLQIQDMKEKLDNMKQNQIKDLNSKLQEKLKNLKRQKKLEQQAELTKDLLDQEMQLDKHSETAIANLTPITITEDEIPKIKEENSLNELEKKIIRDEEEAFNDVKKKLEEEHDNNAKELMQAQKKKVFALKSRMEADIASSGDKEKQRIVDEYNNQLSLLEKKNEKEREKQAKDLAQKLEQQRKRLQKKREEELKMAQKEEGQTVRVDKQRQEYEQKKMLDLLMDEKQNIQSIEDAVNKVLAGRHVKEIEQLNTQQAEELKSTTDSDKIASLKLKHAKQRVKLKEGHIAEKKEYVKNLDKYKNIVSQGSNETKALEDEFLKFSSQIEHQKEELKKKIEAEKERIRLQVERELEEAKKKAEEEKRKLEERLKEERNKYQVTETIKEREKEIEEMLQKQKNLETDERQRLLEQHKSNMDSFENALEMERRRQERILINSIKEREKLKQKEEEEKLKRKLEEVTTGKKQDKGDKSEAHSARSKKRTEDSKDASKAEGTKQKEIDENKIFDEEKFLKERGWMNPILQKIRNIEKLLSLQYPPYCDQKDLVASNEGKLIPVPVDNLTIPQLVVFKIGEFIINLLKTKLNMKMPINLAIASSLPHTNYAHNAFKHSFYYQAKTSTLFIRDVRLSNVGKFIVILVHCIAHLAFGEFESDLHPDYIRIYYSMIEIVFEQIFNSRNRNGQMPKDIPIEGNRAQIVDQMIDFTPRPIQNGDELNAIRLIPGRTEVDIMMKHKSQNDGPELLVIPTELPGDRIGLEKEIAKWNEYLKTQQQAIVNLTNNLKSVDEATKNSQKILDNIQDKNSLEHKKESTKTSSLMQERDDVARRLKNANTKFQESKQYVEKLNKAVSELNK